MPDGNYVFRVNGSIDTENVSTLDGTILSSAGEAYDNGSIVNNIPVANGPSRDDVQLAKDIWFAPNPYTGTGGYFHIPIYTTSELGIKIYNLTGDLVYRYDSGLLAGGIGIAGGEGVGIKWGKVNSAGKPVAPGVYFAVIRLEGRDGSKGAFQTVKKILVP